MTAVPLTQTLQLKTGISSVLFICNKNLVRSPMAEGLLKRQLVTALAGTKIFVESGGIDPNSDDDLAADIDGFVVSVMNEIGIDLARHHSKPVEIETASEYDIVICLTLQAYEKMKHIQESSATLVEHWKISDPSLAVGNRDQRLELYRIIRDTINRRIEKRFFDFKE